MRKITAITVYRIIRIIFVITACIGLFFLVGYIGNVDYCAEIGIESVVGLKHLLTASGVFLLGVIGYKIVKRLERGL